MFLYGFVGSTPCGGLLLDILVYSIMNSTIYLHFCINIFQI